jgi:tRNA1(Val) A37 N6-methylase TrmN6
MEQKINNLSNNYTNDVDKTYLSKFGQFFTLDPILIEKLFDKKLKPKNILEPSSGTGRIVLECLKYYSNAKIDAVEIDKNLYNKSRSILKNANFINKDFLLFKTTNKYDLIIGNPPYFETTDYNKKEYQEIEYGRMNIYSLFIFKCIKLLEIGGELRFIIPTSILTSKSFNKLREYIIRFTEIKDIIKFNDNNLFSKVNQNVIILVLKKQKNTGKHIYRFSDRLVFIKDLNLFVKLLKGSVNITKLKCIVKTGNIEWNKYKNELLPTTSQTKQLIRTSGNYQLKLTNENKCKLIKEPCILVNRIISILNPKFIVRYKKDFEPVFIENHINVIFGSKENLNKIYKSLTNDKTCLFLKEFVSNTQISQDELQNIIPIYI